MKERQLYTLKFGNMIQRSISEFRARQQRERIHIHDLKRVFLRHRTCPGADLKAQLSRALGFMSLLTLLAAAVTQGI